MGENYIYESNKDVYFNAKKKLTKGIFRIDCRPPYFNPEENKWKDNVIWEMYVELKDGKVIPSSHLYYYYEVTGFYDNEKIEFSFVWKKNKDSDAEEYNTIVIDTFKGKFVDRYTFEGTISGIVRDFDLRKESPYKYEFEKNFVLPAEGSVPFGFRSFTDE